MAVQDRMYKMQKCTFSRKNTVTVYMTGRQTDGHTNTITTTLLHLHKMHYANTSDHICW